MKLNPFAQGLHQIYLTDFGLAEKKGGTPVFASPECFDDLKHNSDIFSLGRVFLYIILDKSYFFLWLYMPVSKKLKSLLKEIIENEPFLKLISNMTKVTNRFNIKTVRKNFEFIRQNSLLYLDKSVEFKVNSLVNGAVDEEHIRNFHLNYIDELHNLS